MRQLAIAGLAVSVLLAGVTVFGAVERTGEARNSQDRALQAAVSGKVALVASSEHQVTTTAAQLLVNPAVRALLAAGSPSAAPASAVAGAERALAAFRSYSIMPSASACVTTAAGTQLACSAGPGTPLPGAALAHRLATLADASPIGSVSWGFALSTRAGPEVARVVPMREGGVMRGIVRFDIPVAAVAAPASAGPGVSVALATVEDGWLMDGRHAIALRRLEALGPDGSAAMAGAPGSWLLAPKGSTAHRSMVAALPLPVGGSASELAVAATSTAENPDLLDSVNPQTAAALLLALATLLGSIAALMLAHRRMERELGTDLLTGLRNRRALMADLPRACERASEDAPVLLWFFDLNGFKAYNDSFGHDAGDELLARLGRRLADAIRPHGTVYRLGGDEFCALVAPPPSDPHALFHRARAALREHGGGFQIDASAGAVEIPREADGPRSAMRIADHHMYRDKATSRSGAAELVTAVLHAALAQRHPELDEHSSDVAEDVELLAREIGLDEHAVAQVIRAGDLHDVGKLGIPDEIIGRRGPLSDSEWAFMRQHTVMGERILSAAGPSLEQIAPLVRASHERWDGKGYPDGLVAEQIPLGARIITICDSFRAMLSARPYKAAMSIEDALAELRRCSGTQFDPALVEVFCRLVEERAATEPLRRSAV